MLNFIQTKTEMILNTGISLLKDYAQTKSSNKVAVLSDDRHSLTVNCGTHSLTSRPSSMTVSDSR